VEALSALAHLTKAQRLEAIQALTGFDEARASHFIAQAESGAKGDFLIIDNDDFQGELIFPDLLSLVVQPAGVTVEPKTSVTPAAADLVWSANTQSAAPDKRTLA
jgi:hypothetical protein